MGDNTAKGIIKLDATVTPARIDVSEVEGRNPGRTLVGLANTTGEGWKLALNIQGGDRPTALSSEAGTALITYKRKPGTVRPLRGLLITGGCCHDYPGQAKILTEGLSARVNIGWDVVMDPGQTGTKADDWAAKYDVVVHNECFADEKELDWLERIVRPHREGVPAVVIHCAMHCYRAPTNEWFRFVGVTSHGHGSHFAYAMTNVAPAHPVMKGFPATWQTPKEELYNIASVEPTATPLATGWSHETKKAEVNVWVNQFGKARVFGTTIGHYNHTLQDPAVLDLLSRGLLWSTGKLNDDGKPATGYGR
jgi:type 1 glutamine amidotransferase